MEALSYAKVEKVYIAPLRKSNHFGRICDVVVEARLPLGSLLDDSNTDALTDAIKELAETASPGIDQQARATLAGESGAWHKVHYRLHAL